MILDAALDREATLQALIVGRVRCLTANWLVDTPFLCITLNCHGALPRVA